MKDNLSFYEKSKQKKPVTIVSIPLELGSDERGLAAAACPSMGVIYIDTYRKTNVTRTEEKIVVRRELGQAM